MCVAIAAPFWLFTTFILESIDETYDDNLKAIENMLDTLKAGYHHKD